MSDFAWFFCSDYCILFDNQILITLKKNFYFLNNKLPRRKRRGIKPNWAIALRLKIKENKRNIRKYIQNNLSCFNTSRLFSE